MLASEAIAKDRGTWRTIDELEHAFNELRDLSASDDLLRHSWRLPKGDCSWLKVWCEEWEPALILCRHMQCTELHRLMMLAHGVSAVDLLLRYPDGKIEHLELTTAYRDDGRSDAGYQEALRAEMLNQGDSVSEWTLLRRNPETRRVEEAEESMPVPVERVLEDWVRGLTRALENKKKSDRPSYGEGSSLIVYCYGISGDFGLRRNRWNIDDVVERISTDAFRNRFDKTVLVGWHDGWMRSFDRRAD